MRKYVIIILLLISSKICFSRVDPNIGRYFEFVQNISLNYCDGLGNITTGSDIVPAGTQFRVDGISPSGGYVIHILKNTKDVAFSSRYFNSSSAMVAGKPVIPSSPDTYFELSKADFDAKSKPRLTKNSFTIGIVTLPIKMRFGSSTKVNDAYVRNFLLTSDVALGFSVGYKRKWNEHWGINFLTGVTLSSIQVDSSTTNGYAKSAANASALTWHIGSLIEIDNFQFGIFTGVDYVTGEMGRNWVYRNKFWGGIAIGYSIFKTKSPSDTQ